MDDKNKQADITVFSQLLTKKYAVEGKDEQKTYLSSRELKHMFQDFCEPSIAEISMLMLELKFKHVKGFWVLYLQESEEQDFTP